MKDLKYIIEQNEVENPNRLSPDFFFMMEKGE